MTIRELLNWLDGQGLIITDEELLEDTLKDAGHWLDESMLFVEKYQEN